MVRSSGLVDGLAVAVCNEHGEKLLLPCVQVLVAPAVLLGTLPIRRFVTDDAAAVSTPSASCPSAAAADASGTGRPNINGTPGSPHFGQAELTAKW
jgi:hypothetical protein